MTWLLLITLWTMNPEGTETMTRYEQIPMADEAACRTAAEANHEAFRKATRTPSYRLQADCDADPTPIKKPSRKPSRRTP